MNWSTRIEWRSNQNWVVLMHGKRIIAEMSLDDWAELGATKYLIEEAKKS